MICLPADWTTKPLGSVATLQRGFDLPVQARREGSVTIFAANGPVGTHNVIKVKGPGVVTGRSGTLGKVHLVKEHFWPLNTALWVKDFHGNDPDWVYRLLSWMRLEQFTRGAGVPTLNRNLVHVVEVPLPPLADQKRIAAILDAADALRAKRREALAQLDALGQSTFLAMFGDPVTNPMEWQKVAVGDLCERSDDVRCGPFGTQLHQDEFTDSGVPLWGIKHVNAGFAFPTDEFVADSKAASLAQYSIIAGDLVMTRKGTIGNCHVYPRSLEPGIMHSDLLRLRLSPSKADTQFVCSQFMYSRHIQRQLELMSPGAVMPGINVTKLKELEVETPPLNLQRRFAAIVESVEGQRAHQRAHLAELDTLFASLQSRAFRGEL